VVAGERAGDVDADRIGRLPVTRWTLRATMPTIGWSSGRSMDAQPVCGGEPGGAYTLLGGVPEGVPSV
jgi:hypothetical protein